jgi:hypothetical protein
MLWWELILARAIVWVGMFPLDLAYLHISEEVSAIDKLESASVYDLMNNEKFTHSRECPQLGGRWFLTSANSSLQPGLLGGGVIETR